MATCAGCGVSVGCGCNLINGLCASCNQKKQQSQPQTNDKLKNN